jgi:nucleotide-binding universal stress UspA family protein
MRTILVGYDETDGSKRALDRAVELANAFGARLIVTSVAPILLAAGRGAGATDPVDSPQLHREELAHARAYLEEHGIDAEYVPAIGDPAKTIALVAEKHDADLIVVGTREPGLAERVLRSSVSQAVSRRAHRDVLIVHPV